MYFSVTCFWSFIVVFRKDNKKNRKLIFFVTVIFLKCYLSLSRKLHYFFSSIVQTRVIWSWYTISKVNCFYTKEYKPKITRCFSLFIQTLMFVIHIHVTSRIEWSVIRRDRYIVDKFVRHKGDKYVFKTNFEKIPFC